MMTLLACDPFTAAQQTLPSPACIEIRETTPAIISANDAGDTVEPIHLVIQAYGQSQDLKDGKVLYSEDGEQKEAISVGDLKPGMQSLTIPAGLHCRASERLFSFSILQPDGTEIYGSQLPLNSVGYAPPTKRKQAQKLHQVSRLGDLDYEIATRDPGTDPNEVMAIARFQAKEIGITFIDGDISLTEGNDRPAQILTFHGTNLRDGLLVRFRTRKGGQLVEATAPLTKTKVIAKLRFIEVPRDDMPTTLYQSTVVVPASITHSVRQRFSVRSVNGDAHTRCK